MLAIDFYNERERIKAKIAEHEKALKSLEKEFIAEHRQIPGPCAVTHDGETYYFTGEIYTDICCDLLYELQDTYLCLIYVQFEDLEVINDFRKRDSC